MTPTRTGAALERLAAPLRRSARLAAVGASAGAAAFVLGVGAWLAVAGVLRAPLAIVATWAIALAAGVALLAFALRAGRGLDAARVARALEAQGGWRRGALLALLQPAQAGASAALAAAADAGRADELSAAGAPRVAEAFATLRRRVRAAGAVLAAGLATLGGAAGVGGAAAGVFHPVRAWRAAVAPVRLAASAQTVDRGDSVTFTIEADGRREATLWLRAPGEAWRPVPIALDAQGRAAWTSPALDAELFARATSGGHGTTVVAVGLRLPAFLGALTVTARYPAYLALEDEPLPTTGDTLLLPEGTRLEVAGEATAALAAARWIAAPDTAALEVRGDRFAGVATPRRSGTWTLDLRTASGAPLAGEPVRLPIRILPDSAPQVEIPVPGADTTAPASLRVTLVVDARDDHGLREVAVETQRVSRTGARDPVVRERLALPARAGGRALLDLTLDLQRRGLAPGDTLRYRALVTDNSPRGQTARTREFILRVPTSSEARAEQRRASEAMAAQLDSLAAASREVERAAEDLARQQPRDGARPGQSSEELSFDQLRKAEAIAESQEQLLQRAEEAARTLEELQRAAEAAGVADSAWQQRMEELREQLDRALSPELREKLEALREALKELSAERTQEALKELAEKQQELREALERSRELFERAALEGDLANLADEARELAQEQARWNEEAARQDARTAAAAEQQLAARADSLAAALEQVAKQLAADAPTPPAQATPTAPQAQESPQAAAPQGAAQPQAMQQMAQQARQAAQQMRQAAQQAKQGQRQEAKRQGEQAEESLQPLSEQLDEQREQLQEEWREEVVDALDEALADAGRLAERQLEVTQGLQRGEPNGRMRQEQGAVEESAARLLERLRETSGKNALVSPQIATAMSAAMQQMRRAREAVSTAAPNPREAGERAGEALDALNATAHALARARGNVSGSQSGSGLAEALEQMGQMASQQGQMSQQGQGLLPMMQGGGAQQQLAQLAAQQRAMAQRLERMRGQGQIPGSGEMAEEAQELARQLEAGRLDRQTVERQERLFRRMLDAGRTLQGREEDEQKERESTAATGDSVRLPPALRRLRDEQSGALRVPTWEELQRLSPEERRLVTDYFRRLAAPGAR